MEETASDRAKHEKMSELHRKLDATIGDSRGELTDDMKMRKIEAEIRILHKEMDLPGPPRSVRTIYAGTAWGYERG